MNRGFTLIEVVLALALTALIVGGVLEGLTYAERMPAKERQEQRARMLAGECAAVLRWIRDADGFTSVPQGEFGLGVADGRWSLVPEPDTDDGFIRTVRIDDESSDMKSVQCVVAWDGGNAASVSVPMILSR